jgi:DNA-binding winged helix-turn-helix (wHTH) protein
MQQPVTVRFGPWSLDPGRRQLTRDGTEVHVTPKAFDLLTILVAEAPCVVPKSAMHERLWPGVFVSNATLVGLVKELRRALDDHDGSAPLIRTAHRVGYAFCAATRAAVEREPTVWHWMAVGRRQVPLGPGEHFIGRDPACGVCLDFGSVSRRHARLVVSHADAHIEDLGSKNGTKVGNDPIKGLVRLRDSDRVFVGTVLLVYRTSTSGLSTETHGSGALPTDIAASQR